MAPRRIQTNGGPTRHDPEFRSRLLMGLGYPLSEASTEEDVSRVILEAADQLIGWDAAFVDSYNPEDNVLRPLLTYDLVEDRRERMMPVTPPGPPSPFARSILDGKPALILRKTAGDPSGSFMPTFGAVQRRSLSLLYAPIRVQGVTVGFMSTQSYTINAYTNDDLELLAGLADHCGGALRRARAEARLRSAKDELEGTVRLRTADLMALSQRLQAEVVERTIAEEATRRSVNVLRALISTAGGVAYETDPATDSIRFLGDPRAVIPGVEGRSIPCRFFEESIRRSEPLSDAASSEPVPFPRSVRAGDLWRADQQLELADGTVIWLNHSVVRSFESAGAPEALFGVLLNITERKLAEEMAEQQKNVELEAVREENRYLRRYIRIDTLRKPDAFSRIVTGSRAMQTIFLYIESIAQSGRPLLIQGETGTGKELLARAAHDASDRSGAFVPCNVAGLDEETFSDTLFGHVSGSFTGAEGTRRGLVDQANGGTLFLDEIGDLSRAMQTKLLRLIQEREYYPLGSDQMRHANCAIIAATNADLERLIEQGRFREDLYFRLRTHGVLIPPLRERREDIPVLARHFAQSAVGLPGDVIDLLRAHRWSGNVRELQGIVCDLVATGGDYPWRRDRVERRLREASGKDEGVTLDYGSFPTLREVTQDLIREALRRTDGRQTQAGPLLGITQQSLNGRLKTIRRREKTG